MSERDWNDLIVGERMQVDQEFNEKVRASNFNRQQWGLIMTAVEFEVENPGDPEGARLVADTSKVESVLPELERMENRGGGAVSAGGGGGGSGSGGLLGGLRDALGLGGDSGNREQLAAAEELAQMYAHDLQQKLQSRGKWERVRDAAGTTD
ncbi:hypothetical protein BRC64_06970 [Halobacteriales archaeon QH_10_67_22]|nr:MAG: hypothetical protein BRC64_06970 [Halobacteriales archaeon QH_10_67_22]